VVAAVLGLLERLRRSQETVAWCTLERSAKEAAELLARERAAREAAENLAKEAQDKLKQALPPAGSARSPTPPTTTKKAANTPSAAPASTQPMPPLLHSFK